MKTWIRPLSVLDGDEGPLAEIPDCHDPPGNGEPFLHLLESLVVHLSVGVEYLPGEVGHFRVVGVSLDPRSGKRLDFFPSHLEEITVIHHPSPEVLGLSCFFAPTCRNKVNFTIFFFTDVSRMFSAGPWAGRAGLPGLAGAPRRSRGRKA